jgi:uncharacterized protein
MDKPSDTLTELPLFPLNNVLFPDGPLPLQIFEPRYLDMIARQHAAKEPFGVVCMTEGREIRTPGEGGFAKESLHSVGTLARIDDFHKPQPALMVIACTGMQRFRILRSAQRRFGLWVADVELLPDDQYVPVPNELRTLRDQLRTLFHDAESEAAEPGAERVFKLPVPPRWDDSGWLANRWCELVPMAAEHKQRLMALESPMLRLELIVDALRNMGLISKSD